MRTTNQRAAEERAELYYAAHPGSPSAVRRPKLSIRSGMWIALLGRNIQEGIAGLGPTVERALRAFDLQYLAALHGRDDSLWSARVERSGDGVLAEAR